MMAEYLYLKEVLTITQLVQGIVKGFSFSVTQKDSNKLLFSEGNAVTLQVTFLWQLSCNVISYFLK